MSRVAWSLLLVASTAACGHRAGGPARFSGHRGDRAVRVGAVREVVQRPAGTAPLGRVTARCRSRGTLPGFDREWLGDVDCSRELLRAEIHEKAASVGGELVVGLACSTDPAEPPPGSDFTVTCSAALAGGRGGPSKADPEVPAESRPELPYAQPSDAWRIRVTARPSGEHAPPRAPVEPDRVNERAFLPVSHHVVADVVARCPEGCERRAARYAVRAGAGRVGATDVVGVACVQARDGWLCTGRAARPEVDPEEELRRR